MNLDGQRVLVTGGAGFIGSHVTQDLLDRDVEVHIIDNFFAGKEEHIPGEALFTELDIRSDELSAVVDDVDPDAVLHLAAIHHVPYCNEHPGEAFDVNVMGTQNVLRAVETIQELEKVVFTSTAAVYPPRGKANTETSSTEPIDVYGKTKLVGEDLTQLFEKQTGVPAVTARVFNVYGPNETNPHLIPAILDQIEDGHREIELGNLTPKRDFIHVHDVSSGLVHLLEYEGSYRTFNVGTGDEYSVREVVEQVSDAFGDDLRVVQSEDRTRDTDRSHLKADITRMEDEVGWTPRNDFVSGLRQLLEAEGIVT